jgi:hypothetical protein
MLQDNKDTTLLIVGGTGRNVGKTEFVCGLIKKIASIQDIYALKVSAIFPDEEIYHGNHTEDESEHHLFEETRAETGKDTSRMLRAGASRVFYLRGEDSTIQGAYAAFRRLIPAKAAVICESNSLGEHIRPALQVMIRQEGGVIKPRALPRLRLADLVVLSDGTSGFPELRRIHYDPLRSWYLSG